MYWLLKKLVKAMGKKRAAVLFLVLAAMAAAVFGCLYLFPRSANAVPVSVTIARDKPLSIAEGVDGAFAEHSFTVVSARVSGVVEKVDVHVGDRIDTGTVLAQFGRKLFAIKLAQAQGALENAQANLNMATIGTPLDVDQLKAQVAAARANYRNAQKSYGRSLALFNSGAMSQSSIDDVKTALSDSKQTLAADTEKLAETVADSRDNLNSLQGLVTEARAGVDSARYDLANSLVTSPVPGTVIERNVDPGTSVSDGSPLFKVSDVTDLLFKAQVSQMFLSYLHNNQSVQIISDNLRGTAVNGKIAKIYPVPTDTEVTQYNDNVNYEVDILVHNEGNIIKPGMTGQLLLNIHIPDTIMLTEDTIIYSNDKASVFVVENGVAVQKVVNIGIERGTQKEIISGIANDAKVVLDPGDLTNGQSVRITNVKACSSDKQDY